MAARIEFEGAGEPLLAFLQKARDGTAALLDGVEKTNASTKKFGQDGVQAAEKFAQGVALAGGAVGELNKQAGSGFVGKLAKDVAQAGKDAQVFGANMQVAGDLSEAAFAQLVTEARNAAREQGIVVKSIDAGKKATVDSLVAAKALTAEEGRLAVEALEVLDAFKQQAANAGKAAPGLIKSATAGNSLRTQLRAAREELARLEAASDGKITPELVAAAQRAGILQDRLHDVNATIQAFNPDAKFQAFSQVVTAGAGALTAFQGVMGLVGAESDNVGKALLKVQSALAITQGLQAFFGGFRDGVRNIRAVLLSMTLAQKGATAATVVDTQAKAAQATTTVAATTATGGLTTALNSMKVALLSNPITAILVVLAAAVVAMLAFASGTEVATQSYEELLDTIKRGFDLQGLRNEVKNAHLLVEVEKERLRRLADVSAGKRASADQTAAEIDEERVARKIADDEAIFAIRARRDAEAAAFREIQDLVNRGVSDDASPVEREKAFAALGLPDEATTKEVNKAIDDIIADNAEKKAKALTDIAAIDQAGTARSADRLQKDLKVQQDRLQATKDFNDALLKEIDRLEKEVTARLEKAKLESASPRERIELEQQARQKEIDELQLNITRKLAIIELEKTLSVAAIKNLSEAQLNARTDALIAEGKVRLSPEQLAEFQTLRFAAEEQGERALSDLLIKEAAARIELITNAQDRERIVFEQGLQAKVEAARLAGSTDEEILRFEDQQRALFNSQRKAKAIQTEEDIALAGLDAKIAAAGEDERLVRKLELRKLAIQAEFARARLAAIVDDGSKESAAQRAALEKTIAEIDAAALKLQKDQKPVSILDLLGIKTEDQAEVSAALQSIVSSVQTIISQAIAAQQAEVEARITATDEIIADAQRRKDELQAQLEEDLENQRLGLANNVDATRAAIEANRKEEEKAIADKKRLIEEQKKLARQQAIADSISQVSSLLTAGATLFAKGAFSGPAGIITSIATIAAMIAAFIAMKARIAAATSSFRYGGVHMLEGPDHFHGGLAVIDRRTGEVKAEAEGGEAAIGFVRREQARTAMPYLKALNTGGEPALLEMARKEIERVTSSQTIRSSEVSKVVESKERLLMSTTVIHEQSTERLEKRIDALRDEVRGFKDQEGKKPRAITRPSGAVEVHTPGKVRVIRPEKPKADG